MAISLSSLRKVRATLPPRLLIYGPEKIGKTTLASEFPNPVFIQTEDGETAEEITTFGKLTSFDDVYEAMGSLYSEPHDFATVVLDSLSALQPLIWQKVIQDRPTTEKGKPVKQIEDYGYGKGYAYALDYWKMLIEGVDALRRDRNMAIVLVGHSKVSKIEPPESDAFNRYQVDINDKASDLLAREMDGILFLKCPIQVKEEDAGFNATRKRGTGSSIVLIHTDKGNPAYSAGTRYNMPPSLRYDKGKGYEALAPYFPGNQADEAAEQKDAA